MRDAAIATALGPVAVAGLLASRHVRAHGEPGGHEDAARPGPAAPPAVDEGTGRYATRAVDASMPLGYALVGADPGNPGDSHAPEPPAGGGGVHAGRDIHVENQGSGAAVGQAHIVNNYQVTQAAVRLPYRIGRVPALASPFQERDIPELEGSDSLVLAGMLGTGKTQLAARLAESAWDSGELHLLLWVEASSREAVLSAYARAGQDVLGRTYADVADGAQAFLNWLRPAGGTQPHPWLVVLDGVTDPAHLAGLWPPASPGGRVLVTSGRADFEGAGSPRVVRVRPFTFAEAHAYLEHALELNPAARRVAGDDVGGFLFGAAWEIEEGGLALDTYLETRHAAASGRDGARPTPVQRSIEAAAAMAPDGVARAVLAVITLLDGDRVPEDILRTEAGRQQIALLADRWRAVRTQRRSASAAPAPATSVAPAAPAVTVAPAAPADPLAPVDPAAPWPFAPRAVARTEPVDVDDVRAALRVLHATGLVDREEFGAVRCVSTVPSVRRASLADVPPLYLPEGQPVLDGLLDAVAEAWPDVERSLAHARSLWAVVEALGVCDAEIDGRSVLDLRSGGGMHPVAFRYGRSLGAWGRYGRAEEYFRDMVWLASDVLGTEHPDMLKGLARAARWRGARGDEFGAARELADVLARQRTVLGDGHPELLTTRFDLAAARLSAIGWDAPAPRAELTAVLGEQTRVLGPDHLDTLGTASEIVAAVVSRAEDEQVATDVAAAAELLAGGDHPPEFSPTALTKALHARLLRVAGAGHPSTVAALGLRAGAHIRIGAHAEALVLVGRALADAERALGPEHPVARECLVAAAVAGFTKSGPAAFVGALRDAHDRWEELERGHRWTLMIRARLLRFSSPDPAEFAETSAELLADTERVFGTDHRRTRQLLADMADMLEEADRPVAALVALADLAARCARVPGPEHPGTLRARLRLAAARGRQADTVGALTALTELHADCLRALGPEHRTTLDTRHELALNRYVAGDEPGALSDLARLLRTHQRLHGDDAESTRAVRDDLERLQAED